MPNTLLQIAPPTDGNRLTPKIVIASIVMVVVGVAVFLLNPRKTAELSVQKTQTFSPHTKFEATQSENKVIGEAPSTEDDVYVVVTYRITNKLRLPISLDSTAATVTTADGSTIEGTVVAPQELPRLEAMFPQIRPMVSAAPPAIPSESRIEPGAMRVGSVVLLFPQIAAKDWQAKKSAMLTVNLAHDAAPISTPIP